MESDLPWMLGAVRQLLLADEPFATATGGRVSTRLPGTVTVPLVTLQIPAPLGAMGGGGYKPIVQGDAWCAPTGAGEEDPELIVWHIAVRGARVLERARNVPYGSMHYSARLLDLGPLPADRSRGDASPVYRAMFRAELTIHNI